LGRERARRETNNGAAALANISTYDALGRLEATFAFDSDDGVSAPERQFTYDPLGNVLAQTDVSSPAASGSAILSYQSTDRDRICSIGYGSAALSAACDVKYDGLGNITEQKSRSNGVRKFEYFANGQMKKIVDGNGNAADFRYDAFGAVQQLELTGNTPDTRHDHHFGGLISVRDETTDGSTIRPVITRTIPGPGISATRHGATGPWIFALGESRGNRFFIEAGDFVQDVSYAPYGEATSTGQQPHFAGYSSQQWNSGDTLAAFGLSQLGARIYDPVIGRFLSRDPMLIPRTAATTNPYAFAMNDPVNSADPTGLDSDAECLVCQPPPFDPLPGLPGFPGGPPSHPSGGGSKPSGGPVNGAVVSAEDDTRFWWARHEWNYSDPWASAQAPGSYEHLKRGPLGLLFAVTDEAIDTTAGAFAHSLEGTGFNYADAEYVKSYLKVGLEVATVIEGGYSLVRSLGRGGAGVRTIWRMFAGGIESSTAADEAIAGLPPGVRAINKADLSCVKGCGWSTFWDGLTLEQHMRWELAIIRDPRIASDLQGLAEGGSLIVKNGFVVGPGVLGPEQVIAGPWRWGGPLEGQWIKYTSWGSIRFDIQNNVVVIRRIIISR
jgi:RHS repeat-associated protein